jgi:S-phase kinase-associated protein 1
MSIFVHENNYNLAKKINFSVMSISLQSSDGREFTIEKSLAERSILLKNLLENVQESCNDPIPLPNVTGAIMEKILIYLEHHKNDPIPTVEKNDDEIEKKADDIDDWDRDYINVDNNERLFEIILAANYLDIKPLLELGCKTVANIIKDKAS